MNIDSIWRGPVKIIIAAEQERAARAAEWKATLAKRDTDTRQRDYEDRLRSQEDIDKEVKKIKTAILSEIGVQFLNLDPTERARAIVKHRSFISRRVNEQLWGVSATLEEGTQSKNQTGGAGILCYVQGA